jgi:hypothetical protein
MFFGNLLQTKKRLDLPKIYSGASTLLRKILHIRRKGSSKNQRKYWAIPGDVLIEVDNRID